MTDEELRAQAAQYVDEHPEEFGLDEDSKQPEARKSALFSVPLKSCDAGYGTVHLAEKDGRRLSVAYVFGPDQGISEEEQINNAAFIVKACNNHESLVSFLTFVQQWVGGLKSGTTPIESKEVTSNDMYNLLSQKIGEAKSQWYG